MKFPGDPATAVARIIKEHHKKITRIEARLDQGESNRSKDSTDIASNTTSITSNTTAITAVNTGSGGTTQENFLGSLGEMSHIANGSPTAGGPWSDSGVLQGGPTTYWTATAADALIAWMNDVDNDLQNLYNLVGDLLTELQNSKFMNT